MKCAEHQGNTGYVGKSYGVSVSWIATFKKINEWYPHMIILSNEGIFMFSQWKKFKWGYEVKPAEDVSLYSGNEMVFSHLTQQYAEQRFLHYAHPDSHVQSSKADSHDS